MVTEEELRMLGLNPEELFEPRNVHDSYYSDSSNYDVPNYIPFYNIIIDNIDDSEVDDDDLEIDDDDIDDDDLDEIIQDFHSGYYGYPSRILSPGPGSQEFDMESMGNDDGEDNDTGEEELGDWSNQNESYDSRINLELSSDSDEESENNNTSSPIESDHSWDTTSLNDELHGDNISSDSDDSSDTSQSGISFFNGSISTTSSSSCSSSSSS